MSDDNEPELNTFASPRFIAAAVVVAALIIGGIVLAIVGPNGDKNDAEAKNPDPATNTTPSTPASKNSDSICGLSGVKTDGTVSKAPEAVWKYEGTTAYPISGNYGPGAAKDGYRYCFQHSPEGALFAAANTFVMASNENEQQSVRWGKYVLAGPHREEILENSDPTAESSSSPAQRMQIQGFRLLDYSDTSSRVDLAVRGTADGQTVTVSFVFDLVWLDGDWKWNIPSKTDPYHSSVIPDTAGYVAWEPNP